MEFDQYPDLSGADGVGIDNRAEIKEFPLSVVTSSGRVRGRYRKMMLGVTLRAPLPAHSSKLCQI